ncbi:MAG: hypothetical protein HY273_11475 [Gammaproteobacteria bacterium]|nr:hypothetical protein [Gammaproteobacteria bacterium]
MDIAITAIGAVSAVGANAEQTCASIRAGIARFADHAWFEGTPEDPEWDERLPLTAATVASIDPFEDGAERLLLLAVPALTEVLKNAKLKRADLQKCALLLALPHTDTGTKDLQLGEEFVRALCKRTGLNQLTSFGTNQAGHAGVFVLLAQAQQLLNEGKADFCILGGVDSYLLAERMIYLDQTRRIRTDRNVDGFIPGECAAMVMLERAADAEHRGMRVWATVSKAVFEHEPQTAWSDRASTGKGLADAVSKALTTESGSDRAEWIYCDLNGESYRAFEWGVIRSRLSSRLGTMKKLVHPADCVGDIGAATGALLIACAQQAFKRQYATAREALLWTGSDAGLRSALIVKQHT